MKIKSIYRNVKKSRYSLWIYLGVITLLYILLVSNSFFYLIPQGSYDDGLQFKLAKSLSSGEWLGAYNGVTLAKGITYPAWTAFLHTMDVPLWLGNAALYSLACLSFVFALRYIIPKKWVLAGVYAFMLFNPMMSPRAYRDSIAPALCLFALAWIIGMFFAMTKSRIKGEKDKTKRDIAILTAMGVLTLPAWWFLREDYFWILPFLLGGCVMIVGYLLYQTIKHKQGLRRLFFVTVLLAAPFLATFMTGSAISVLNEKMYGRFIVNDFTSPEFSEAYGALTRIKNDGKWYLTVPVSSSMREKAYKASPAFRELQPCLDNNGKGACVGLKPGADPSIKDYQGGWFFWALRAAVESRGYYQSATKSEKYYIRLAKEINEACDKKTIECSYGQRASLSPPFNERSVTPIVNDVPVAAEYIISMKHADIVRVVTPEPYAPDKEAMSDYLDARYSAEELNLGIRLKRKAQGYIASTYQAINPILFVSSFLILLIGTFSIKKWAAYWREILVGWGLVGLLAIRVIMLSYVDITSFHAINTLYFSSAYPVMLAFEGLVLGTVICMLKAKRNTKEKS